MGNALKIVCRKLQKLWSGLKKQQSIISYSMKVSDASVKASYHIAIEIAVASKPCSDGEFAMNCLLKATGIVSRKMPNLH